MKNGDKPINSIRSNDGSLFTLSDPVNEDWLKQSQPLIGLTKREYFAALAMQTMIAGEPAQMVANRDERYNGGNWKTVVAQNAIEFADELLKRLEI